MTLFPITFSPVSPAAVPPSPLTPADYELLADFRYALRTFAAFSEAAAAKLSLTPQQHQVLLAIKGSRKAGAKAGATNGAAGVGAVDMGAAGAPALGRRGLYVGEIAERLLIRPHTAAELVGRLARLDLVSREADAEDGRRVEVVLTPKAERLLEDLSASHLDELRAMKPLLSRLLARIDGDTA